MSDKRKPRTIAEEILNKDKSIVEEDFEYEEKTSIGGKMMYCRKFSNLSLEEMSEYFGIEKSLLNEYEKDITQPSLQFLLLFSKTFDIPMEKFVDDSVDFFDFVCDYDYFHFFRFRGIYKILYKNLKK